MGVMTVSTSVRPEDLAVVAGARGHSLDLDQSKQNGGRENTLKPMEVVLAALGGHHHGEACWPGRKALISGPQA